MQHFPGLTLQALITELRRQSLRADITQGLSGAAIIEALDSFGSQLDVALDPNAVANSQFNSD